MSIDREELRFSILLILAASSGQKASGPSISRALSRDRGLDISRDALAIEYAWLDEVASAVVDQDVDGVHILSLTEEGREHLLGMRLISKIRRPYPDELTRARGLLQ
jgi:hypothetical protein